MTDRSADCEASLGDGAVTRALVDAALRGDRAAVVSLVQSWTPLLRSRIGRVLARSSQARSVSAAVDDVAQQVMVVLFAEHGKVLRSWDPARGLSLPRFVALIAERQALATVRSRRTNPFCEAPMEPASLELHAPEVADPENALAAHELFREIAERMRIELSPLGMQMFVLLFVKDKTVEETCAELSMSADAVYAWRSRLIRQARTLAAEILSETKDAPQSTKSQGST